VSSERGLTIVMPSTATPNRRTMIGQPPRRIRGPPQCIASAFQTISVSGEFSSYLFPPLADMRFRRVFLWPHSVT
jgi:hypothetical protein